MRVLIDTSIWIDHLRRGDRHLVALLRQNRVLMHPAILGELACGVIPQREQFLLLWLALPRVAKVSFEEAWSLLEHRMLWGRGLGWTDIHLLASTLISGNILWTRDRALRDTAQQLSILLED
jgi:predicted nucleic acid-binding protein